MDLGVIWSLAQAGYSLAATAALAAAWSLWTRAPRGRESALLCGSLLALALFYGCCAADAFLHATRATERAFTVASAFGHTALIMSGTLFVSFLLARITRLNAPPHPGRWLGWVVIAQIGLASAIVLWRTGRLLWMLLSGASAADVESSVDSLVGGGGSVATVLCFTGPLALLSRLFGHVPTRGLPRSIRWLQGHGTSSPTESAVTISPRPVLPATTQQPILVLSLGVLWVAFVTSTVYTSATWTSLSLGSIVLLRLLLLPTLLGLVYYHARFLFFDVLIKQGVLWGTLAMLVTAVAFGTAPLVLSLGTGSASALVSVTAILLVSAGVWLIDRGNDWLDRLLFHRPEYRMELKVISAAMARCTTATALTESVTVHLERALRAAFVRYGTEPATGGDVAVGLGRPERPRGYLTLGPRTRGQQYGSEDLTFVDAVAGQLAGHLEAFEAQEAAQLAAAAELKALRAQINPHFLFNALSTLAELSRGQPDAERTILNLSQVFRYALESTQRERVPLGSEIDAIRAYLEIETERFEEQLRFEIDVPDAVRDTPVPPMLLQPLVENAVRHGLSAKIGGGTVTIAAARDNGYLRLSVQDDGVGFDLARMPRGVGLANVGARVERTGGSCRVQSIPGAGTRITLALAILPS
jgi:signal transduction histidine kinase